jgi:hypothetical protein
VPFLVDLTEYGDIVFATLDEWGRRKIDSLLEDGTIIVVAVPPVVVVEKPLISPPLISPIKVAVPIIR